MSTNGYRYVGLICGGRGPDVWDGEIEIRAENLISAAAVMHARAQQDGGDLVSVEQVDDPPAKPLAGGEG